MFSRDFLPHADLPGHFIEAEAKERWKYYCATHCPLNLAEPFRLDRIKRSSHASVVGFRCCPDQSRRLL